jgi:hypothetical protein
MPFFIKKVSAHRKSVARFQSPNSANATRNEFVPPNRGEGLSTDDVLFVHCKSSTGGSSFAMKCLRIFEVKPLLGEAKATQSSARV